MKKKFKKNPAKTKRNRTIAGRRIEGATYQDLASEFGLSKTSISLILNDEEIRGILDEGSRQQAALIPLAISNLREFLTGSNETLKFKASKSVLDNTGIGQAHTPSVFIQNIHNQANIGYPPEILEALRAIASGKGADVALDLPDSDKTEKPAD